MSNWMWVLYFLTKSINIQEYPFVASAYSEGWLEQKQWKDSTEQTETDTCNDGSRSIRTISKLKIESAPFSRR